VGFTPPPPSDLWYIDVEMLEEEYSQQMHDCHLERRIDGKVVLETIVLDATGTKKTQSPPKVINWLSGQVVMQGWREGSTFTCRIYQGGTMLGDVVVTNSGTFKTGGESCCACARRRPSRQRGRSSTTCAPSPRRDRG